MIKRMIPLVLMLGLIGCSSGTEVIVLAQDELPSELYGEALRPRTEERTVRATLYFIRTDEDGVPLPPPRLAKVERENEPSTLPEAEIVMDLLLTDPTANPSADEPTVRTAIHRDTQLLSISVEGGLADVNLSADFERAESEVIQLMRIAQVVYTLTELSEVDAVRFGIHGAIQPVVDQDGVAHERVTRALYARFAPPAGSGDVSGGPISAD